MVEAELAAWEEVEVAAQEVLVALAVLEEAKAELASGVLASREAVVKVVAPEGF